MTKKPGFRTARRHAPRPKTPERRIDDYIARVAAPTMEDVVVTLAIVGDELAAPLTPAEVLSLTVVRNVLRCVASQGGPEAVAIEITRQAGLSKQPAFAQSRAARARLLEYAQTELARLAPLVGEGKDQA